MDQDLIGLRRIDLQHLEDEFTEEEVNAVIQEIAPEKAPGPDGFIGSFYKASWNVIKGDVLAAVNYFFCRHDQHFNLLNSAHIVLLPKKEGATSVGDFRPISLSHSITSPALPGELFVRTENQALVFSGSNCCGLWWTFWIRSYQIQQFVLQQWMIGSIWGESML